MAQVVVRVELHGATTEDQYQRLHTAMQARGFARTIVADGGARYLLPTATYYSDRYADAASATDAAWQGANGIAPSYAVLATCGPSAWRGLQSA